MKKWISLILIGFFVLGMLESCRPKKCADFTNAKGGHNVKYNRKGLVKKK